MQCLRMSHSKRDLRHCDQSSKGECDTQQKRSRTGSTSHDHSHPSMVIREDGTVDTDNTLIIYSPEELQPSYHTVGGDLGCLHYARGCRLRAPSCNRLYVCRLCHDDSNDHARSEEHTSELQSLLRI